MTTTEPDELHAFATELERLASPRPLVIDLFCGGGGASVGYWLAGFDVIGVDLNPQPHYPFTFVQADALDFIDSGRLESVTAARGPSVTVVAASPPCQLYSCATPKTHRDDHPDLVDPIRSRLTALVRDPSNSIAAYVVENVPGAPMKDPARICGGYLGLGVRRHRLFDSNLFLWSTPCDHSTPAVTVAGTHGGPRRGQYVTAATGREAMGTPWLPWPALAQSIPPAYTLNLGTQLLDQLDPANPRPTRHLDTLAPRCRCGRTLHRSPTGRWSLHCSHRCRQAAYRARMAGAHA